MVSAWTMYSLTLSMYIICSSYFYRYAAASTRCFQDNQSINDSSYDLSPRLHHISEFSLNLFREISKETQDENLFISPYSIWNALALAYLGAEGETAAQLRNALGVSSKVETLKKWRAVDFVYQMRQIQSKTYAFGLVNKAYFQKDLKLRECIHDVLYSELELIDFSKPEEAAQTINSFVSNRTEGYISSVTSPSDIKDAEMALVNTAFFRDAWKNPFKKSKTQKEKFFPFSGEEQLVLMMKRKGEFKHGLSEDLRAHVLELPYSLKDVSMYIFLPPSVEGEKGLEHLLNSMTQKSVEEAVQGVWYDNIDVAIPKMFMASSLDFKLRNALQRLGIKDLFDPETTNLTTFVPEGNITVTKTLHQTYLEVSEEGTEAAAATLVQGTGRSARPSYLRSFICNHPFVFMIYDKFTRNILFMGTFRNGLA